MMDEIDSRILEMLSSNANETATEIGASVGLSIPAVNKRIQKLQKEGALKRFTVLTDGKVVGKPITAYILVILICTEIAEAYGGSVEFDRHMSTGPVVNDPAMVVQLRRALSTDDMNVCDIPSRMSSEDFGWYLTRAPGMLFRFGTKMNSSAAHLFPIPIPSASTNPAWKQPFAS